MAMLVQVKAYRMQAGLKQQDVADMLGVSRASYNAKENGHVAFSVNQLEQVRNIINERLGGQVVTIDKLIER